MMAVMRVVPPTNQLSDRHPTLSVASKTNGQITKTLRRSQGRVDSLVCRQTSKMSHDRG